MASSEKKSKRKSIRGGRRTGAGRKPSAVVALRAEIEKEVNRQICTELPTLIRNLMYLANGRFEQVEERWEPGTEATDGTPGEPVLVSRKVTWAAPDRTANQYLIDRVLGRPKQAIEVIDPNEGKPRQIVIPDVDDRPEPDETG